MRNPSDHYLRTINKDFDKVSRNLMFPSLFSDAPVISTKLTNKSFVQEIEGGSDNKYPSTAKAIDILTRSYKASNTCQEVAMQVAQINRMVSN